MTDYLFQEVPVFDRLGVNLMLARKVRIDVLDTVLDLTSPGLKQSGQPVPYVTTDELGRATFTNTQGFARLRGPKGFEQIVYSPQYLDDVKSAGANAQAAAASAASAAALVGAPAGSAIDAYLGGPASGFRAIDSTGMHNEKIGGGTTNAMPAQGAFYSNLMLGGGGQSGASPNLMIGQASLRTLIGGYDNQLGASLAAGIIHGMHVVIDDSSTHGFVAGGSLQVITDSDYSTAVGGTGNIIGAVGAPANYAVAVGGQTNTVKGYHSATVAGWNNTVQGTNSIALAGKSINIYSHYAVAGGLQHTIASLANPTRGEYSTVFGYNHLLGQNASGRMSAIVGGSDHVVDVERAAVTGGKGARPRHAGARAQAMGFFTAAGDAQTYEVVVRRQTTTISATNLLVDNTDVLTMPDDATWAFSGMIVGRRVDGAAEESGIYKIEGAIQRGVGAASVAFLGTPTVTAIFESDATWNVDLTANTTTGNLQIRGQGANSKTINWVGHIRIIEVVG